MDGDISIQACSGLRDSTCNIGETHEVWTSLLVAFPSLVSVHSITPKFSIHRIVYPKPFAIH